MDECGAATKLKSSDLQPLIAFHDSSLVFNNYRFLLLPEKTSPNLVSRTPRLASNRLSADWQARHGPPFVLVESFMDWPCLVLNLLIFHW